MLVRFAVLRKDRRSHVGQGVLHAADGLCGGGRLDWFDEAWVAVVLAWFDRHLPVPTRFARSTRPHAQAKAVSWFRDTAYHFIRRMKELADLLAAYGHVVERLKTDRPGYVVYEVVAEPFRGK